MLVSGRITQTNFLHTFCVSVYIFRGHISTDVATLPAKKFFQSDVPIPCLSYDVGIAVSGTIQKTCEKFQTFHANHHGFTGEVIQKSCWEVWLKHDFDSFMKDRCKLNCLVKNGSRIPPSIIENPELMRTSFPNMLT